MYLGYTITVEQTPMQYMISGVQNHVKTKIDRQASRLALSTTEISNARTCQVSPLFFYIFFPKNNLHSHRDANYIHEYVQDFLTYSYTDSARNCSNIAHHKSTRGGWLQQKTWHLTYWLCLLIILVGKQVDILPVKKHFRNVKY